MNYIDQKLYQPFALLGHARTGSNYLLSGLNSSASIKMYGEIFDQQNRRQAEDVDLILNRVFKNESKLVKAVGFKIFYYHCSDDEWCKLLAWNNISYLHITRKNCLRTITSLDIAFKTQQWSSEKKTVLDKQKCIKLNTTKLLNRLQQIKYYETLCRDRLIDRRVLEIDYEQLTTNPKNVFQAVSEFLGVCDIRTDKITLSRQNPEPLQQLIINYDEVYKLLENTQFACYLTS